MPIIKEIYFLNLNDMQKSQVYMIILAQAILATLWSLYYWWFWDPIINVQTWNLFLASNWFTPCEMCWFARILMYPIVVIVWTWFLKKSFDTLSVLILSWLWIILESYQYRFQMVKSNSEIKSVICWVWNEASCAATDVIYGWFITIPFLCLIAFIVIFIWTLYVHKNK